MNTITTRTRQTEDRYFEQDTHGQKRGGQTPGAMFLETVNGIGDGARVSVIRQTKSGRLSVEENLETREQVLLWVLRLVDGNRTAFDHDDYSARLIVVSEPGPEDGYHRHPWVELLNPDTDSTVHPEIAQ